MGRQIDSSRMKLGELQPIDWLRYLGLLTWVLAAIVLALLPWLMSEPPTRQAVVGWWSAAILFLLAYWHPAIRDQRRAALWQRILLLAVLSIAAFAVSYFTRSGIGSLLAMVVAALLPWLLPAFMGVGWVVFLAMAFGVWVVFTPDGSWLLALVFFIMNLGLTLFPFIASLLAMKQVQARSELRRVNSELLATQSLLAENTRVAERVRISRELHDLVGHHLTALTLNLEVASHLTDGKGKQHVDQAASISRLLLADVREVVSDMRNEGQVDLREALEMLARGVPELQVHLDIPERLSLTDPRRAQILLRCAQELITNTVRHASASNLWISLEAGEAGLSLRARDDGLGVQQLMPGNGLNGMRERLKELGGRLDISTAPGAGFQVRAWMPGEGAA
ncbi:MAG: sensor histidine kinase [Wenzhouxiangella sp.]|nr:MAG: sensor histidine kinase [Wenzhouxiangella sp.]